MIENPFLWQVDGVEIPIHYRPGSHCDLEVLHQVFEAREYATGSWYQGQALRAYGKRRTEEGGKALILDLGAHIGASAVYFAVAFPGSKIIAVEPSPGNAALLRRNAAGRDIEVREAAIGSAEGSSFLHDRGHGEWAYTVESGAEGGVPVPVISPGAILRNLDGGALFPLLCKIDIEGSEAELFSGNLDWVDEFPLLVIELHDWRLPFKGNSRPFQRAILERDFDLLQRGENLFCFNRVLLGKEDLDRR